MKKRPLLEKLFLIHATSPIKWMTSQESQLAIRAFSLEATFSRGIYENSDFVLDMQVDVGIHM